MTSNGLHPASALETSDPVQIGPYRIASKLGQGGMGTVYLAEGPSGPVAIKVINRLLAVDPEFRARFRREVSAARRVRRFCTAPVLDAQLDVEPLWVVTEYVAGPDLGRMLRENGPLEGSNVEALAVGVATALTAIHDAGLVHRDLKPANVLLSPLGPRVIDFGIARALDAGDRQTATDLVFGTPDYMAPEQVQGEQVGPPGDIFAWGCVVVAATVGASPFASSNLPHAMYRVVHDEPDLRSLDPGLRPIVAAALSKDPAQRPTAQELLAALVQRPDVDSAQVAGSVRLDLSPLRRENRESREGREARESRGQARSARHRLPEGSRRRRRRDVLTGAAAALVVSALIAAAVMVWMVNSAPETPPRGEMVYRETFAADNSGWNNEGTGVDTGQGYTGDGRYTIRLKRGAAHRWSPAPAKKGLPDRALASVKMNFSDAGSDTWNGVYCEYSKDDQVANDIVYVLEVRGDGHGKIAKVVGGVPRNMTSDIPLPEGVARGNALLRAECVRGAGQVDLALWADDQLVIRLADTEANKAVGPPRFGLFVESVSETRTYFDDFVVARLP
ncbi:serine/threonine-protein kinase [Nonomuraea fuscirosea]|uniref:serine/threonine-protein kinase n=1 Tax=Nonomuraea fuscirosea TaxID=1291556 RepID=UPI00379B8221